MYPYDDAPYSQEPNVPMYDPRNNSLEGWEEASRRGPVTDWDRVMPYHKIYNQELEANKDALIAQAMQGQNNNLTEAQKEAYRMYLADKNPASYSQDAWDEASRRGTPKDWESVGPTYYDQDTMDTATRRGDWSQLAQAEERRRADAEHARQKAEDWERVKDVGRTVAGGIQSGWNSFLEGVRSTRPGWQEKMGSSASVPQGKPEEAQATPENTEVPSGKGTPVNYPDAKLQLGKDELLKDNVMSAMFGSQAQSGSSFVKTDPLDDAVRKKAGVSSSPAQPPQNPQLEAAKKDLVEDLAMRQDPRLIPGNPEFNPFMLADYIMARQVKLYSQIRAAQRQNPDFWDYEPSTPGARSAMGLPSGTAPQLPPNTKIAGDQGPAPTFADPNDVEYLKKNPEVLARNGIEVLINRRTGQVWYMVEKNGKKGHFTTLTEAKKFAEYGTK